MVEFNILGKDVHLHRRFVTSLLIGPCHNLFFGEKEKPEVPLSKNAPTFSLNFYN